MNCTKCNNKMVLLLTSYVCDFCDRQGTSGEHDTGEVYTWTFGSNRDSIKTLRLGMQVTKGLSLAKLILKESNFRGILYKLEDPSEVEIRWGLKLEHNPEIDSESSGVIISGSGNLIRVD